MPFSPKKATLLASLVFFLALFTLSTTDSWWPAFFLAMGIPLAFRQFLLGRTYDMGISLFVFLGAFITVSYDISWRIFLPVLFSIGALYLLLKEFLSPDSSDKDPPKEG